MFFHPSIRRMPIARLRQVAITRGACPVGATVSAKSAASRPEASPSPAVIPIRRGSLSRSPPIGKLSSTTSHAVRAWAPASSSERSSATGWPTADSVRWCGCHAVTALRKKDQQSGAVVAETVMPPAVSRPGAGLIPSVRGAASTAGHMRVTIAPWRHHARWISTSVQYWSCQ
jgi:hypothetical protein